MNFGQLLHAFMADGKVKTALFVILLDFVLGVLAAFKKGNFRLSYLSDYGRTDLAFKLLPYFVLYSGALVAGNQDIVIPGFDIGAIAGAAYVGFMGSWAGSILNSLAELKISPRQSQTALSMLAGSENTAPPKD